MTIKWATDSGAAHSIPAAMAPPLMAAMNGLGVGEDGVSDTEAILEGLLSCHVGNPCI